MYLGTSDSRASPIAPSLGGVCGTFRSMFSRAVRSVASGRFLRFLFGAMPFGPGLSCFAPRPGKPGLGPCGLRSLSRAPRQPHAGSKVAVLRGCRRTEWTKWVTARKWRMVTVRWFARFRASHRPLPTSSAFARAGGSSSQMSSPGNTMPSTRRPSASTARNEVGRARARRAHPVAPEPDHAVAHRGRGERAHGGEPLEAGRGHNVRFAGDVVQPAAGGVDRNGAAAQTRPHPVDPLPARALAADHGRRCPSGGGLGLDCRALWLRGVWAVRCAFFCRRRIGDGHRRSASSAIARNSLGPSPK